MANYKFNPKWITRTQEMRLYKLDIPVIGLTGGIATGKSTVAKIFREKNFPIIDADALVKKIYQKPEVFDFIKLYFPIAIENNIINFRKLREIAFSSKENISKIESVIYKYLPDEFKSEFQKFNNPPFLVYDVPLMFERGIDKHVDVKICVYSPRDVQIERLMKRDLITEKEANAIIDSQISIEEKKKLSDFSISNTSTLEVLEIEIEKILENFLIKS